MPPFDIDAVRARFPALRDGFAYFDNAGGSLVLDSVADRVRDHLLTTSVQTGASYRHSVRAVERVREARRRVATMMNAERADEIVLGPSTTVLLQNLARAMRGGLIRGDEIVVTDFDHESNIGPWRALEADGVVIRTWSIDPHSLAIDLAALDALLTPRTRLVAVTHTSNLLGTVTPIRAIADRVHRAGAAIVVDGVAYAPHRAIDVQALGVDYYVFSFYKTFGPHFAAMYGRHDALVRLDGLYHYFYGPEQVPNKLEPGNTNYELAWGAAGIVDYLDGLGGGGGDHAAIGRAYEAIAVQEEALAERLLGFLGSRNDVRIFGHRSPDRAIRVPTISFTIDGRDARAVVAAVDAAEIGIRFGDFHSRRLAERIGLGPDGVIRVSMVHYNTIEEVDRLIAALEAAIG